MTNDFISLVELINVDGIY